MGASAGAGCPTRSSGPVRAARCSQSGADADLDLSDIEHAVEARDVENFRARGARVQQFESLTLFSRSLVSMNEDTQSGGVHEHDTREVNASALVSNVEESIE